MFWSADCAVSPSSCSADTNTKKKKKKNQHHLIYLFIYYLTLYLIVLLVDYVTLSQAPSVRDCACLILRCEAKSSLISHLQVAFQPDRVRTLRYSVDLNHRYQGVSSHICTHAHARRQTERHARGNVHISFSFLLILLFIVLLRDVEAKQTRAAVIVQVSCLSSCFRGCFHATRWCRQPGRSATEIHREMMSLL